MASLVYEIISGTQPFEDLTDDEVQLHFSEKNFPEDAISLPYSFFILSGWTDNSSQEIERQGMSEYPICEL